MARCPKNIWVKKTPGSRNGLSVSAPCPNRGTVAIQWGPRRTMVCPSCADELCDGYFLQACRLPDGHAVAALTENDIAQIRVLSARIAGDAGCKFVQNHRGIVAIIQHWGRQSATLRALRKQGFEVLQPNDNPTLHILGRWSGAVERNISERAAMAGVYS